jgi:hypothetical protein
LVHGNSEILVKDFYAFLTWGGKYALLSYESTTLGRRQEGFTRSVSLWLLENSMTMIFFIPESMQTASMFDFCLPIGNV